MKIAIIHHSLNIPGGAERLCLSAIEALRKARHEVTLITVEKTDWSIVERSFGKVTQPDNESYLTRLRFSKNLPNALAACAYFTAHVYQLLSNKSRKKYDLLINTFGDVINSVADITYVHFPLRAAVEFSQVPAFFSNSIWRAAAPLYDAVLSCLDRIPSGKLLTNSKFMRNIIVKVLHREPLVVYPPVEVADFKSRCFRSKKSGCTVVTISSFTPKRHIDQIPYIAKHSRFAKFIVMGKADEYSLPTLEKMQDLIRTLHVENRVKLLTNVPFNVFQETLSQAKIYLHVMPYDHFGISVVEGMASGCVPVVHRSGGPWLDILDAQQNEYGFSYTSPEEAADIIDILVTDENLRSEVASKALNRAKRFDQSVFKEKIVEVVEDFGS